MYNSILNSIPSIAICTPNQTCPPTPDSPDSSLSHAKDLISKLNLHLPLNDCTDPQTPFLMNITAGAFEQTCVDDFSFRVFKFVFEMLIPFRREERW
jgi:hypothetical protein